MVRRVRKLFFLVLLIGIALPVAAGAGWFASRGWPQSWASADWSSAGIALDPRDERRAVVQVWAARTGRWKGIFATHSWIVTKRANAKRFDRYDVVGWGRPVRKNRYPVDGRWYGNEPRVIYELRGPRAASLIPEIERAVARYPWTQPGSYRTWPGPNSNTFIGWVARAVEGFDPDLPPTAIGKDFAPGWFEIMETPSNSGWQVSLKGLAGASLSAVEGVELHILGATLGIGLDPFSLKLPSLGRLSWGGAPQP